MEQKLKKYIDNLKQEINKFNSRSNIALIIYVTVNNMAVRKTGFSQM